MERYPVSLRIQQECRKMWEKCRPEYLRIRTIFTSTSQHAKPSTVIKPACSNNISKHSVRNTSKVSQLVKTFTATKSFCSSNSNSVPAMQGILSFVILLVILFLIFAVIVCQLNLFVNSLM